MLNRVLLIVVFSLTLGFAQEQSPQEKNLDATLWVQTSGEWQILCSQAYRNARDNLKKALEDKNWTAALEQKEGYQKLPPAIILDIDETVLDNSRFQGKMVVDNTSFSGELWNKWVLMEEATPIPGALELINEANRLGIKVLYITNRECSKEKGLADCPQKAATINNLAKLGFPKVATEDMLIKYEKREWGSEKTPRRDVFASKYRILMLFGDDMGDFAAGVKGPGATQEKRRKIAEQHASKWGERWFMLPNPLYGSWIRAIDNKHKAIRSF